jgi:hypothetical protein
MHSRASRTGTCKLGTCLVFHADRCFSENFQPPPIPRIGTQAYFEFVCNRREHLHRALASVNPLMNGRHDFPQAPGIGDLQYGERYDVFS